MGQTLTYTLLVALLSASATERIFGWSPGVGDGTATSGFTVDRQSRSDVASFWHHIYQASEGYEDRMQWTGALGVGPGTTSAAFKDDVQRRINYYRAMAGMGASMELSSLSTVYMDAETPNTAKPAASTTKEEAAQAAAFMVTWNTDAYKTDPTPHDPPLNWVVDGYVARNGAFYSNLSSGVYGPGAIDAYIQENDQGAGGGANTDVAHRRLILFSRQQEFATGDVPPDADNPDTYAAANALYVAGDLLESGPEQFVAWPSAGFFPAPLSSHYWSLSFPGADFSSASVAMTRVGAGSVSASVVSRDFSAGDATLVWQPNPDQMPDATSQDHTYVVTVSGIVIGGVTQSYQYEVTMMNPDRLPQPLELRGSISPPTSGARYLFDPAEGGEAYQLDVSRQEEVHWGLGGESGDEVRVWDGTDPAYDLVDAIELQGSPYWDQGSFGYRLAFPRTEWLPEEQNMVVRTSLLPRSGAELQFRLRRGYMVSIAKLRVQSSTDGGVTWVTLKEFSGRSDNGTDTKFSDESVALPSLGEETLVRFNLYHPAGGSIYSVGDFPNAPVGVFMDAIQFTHCDALERLALTEWPGDASEVRLDGNTAGGDLQAGQTYVLRLRTQLGARWLAFGTPLQVVPVDESTLSSYDVWMRGEYPGIGEIDDDYDGDGIANGVERVFGMDPTDKTDAGKALEPEVVNGKLQLSHAIIPGGTVLAEYSYTLEGDSWEEAAVTVTDGVATASVPLDGQPTCYLRWKVNE